MAGPSTADDVGLAGVADAFVAEKPQEQVKIIVEPGRA